MDDFKTYVTIDGDTLDIIALDFYDDENKANLIARENPQYANVIVFTAGVTLKIPVIPAEAAATLPPWKR